MRQKKFFKRLSQGRLFGANFSNEVGMIALGTSEYLFKEGL